MEMEGFYFALNNPYSVAFLFIGGITFCVLILIDCWKKWH